MAADVHVEPLLRELAPRALGAVVRRYRDFSAAEDAVQEALIAAATRWPSDGMPSDPLAWLIRVASRRITDQIRSESARRRREQASADPLESAADGDSVESQDDSLVLLFLCCHPSLSTSSAIALTLRAVGGLSSAEIARAFLVPEATLAQRISRAKQTIKDSGSAGAELQRIDLSSEAIRLARMLHALLPRDAEVEGLLALMLLTDARRPARTGAAGELIPLDQQDRSVWDRAAIREGVALVSAALSKGAVGAYQLQAAIAAVHDEAASAEATDWPQILALYGLLSRMSDNPMVALNQAIATAMVHGPALGLKCVDALAHDPRLSQHYRLDAVRAHLLERAGQPDQAIEHYRRAAARTSSTPERNYLLTQAARLNESYRRK
jgi:RNA polymerase sigma factor (sigma-70 family)